MNAEQLAKKMMLYGSVMKQAERLEKEISDAVLELGKTQVVGNVRATYKKPRNTYQSWEDAVLENEPDGFVPDDYLVFHEPTMDWKKAADDFEIKRKSWVAKDAKASVSVKIEEEK